MLLFLSAFDMSVYYVIIILLLLLLRLSARYVLVIKRIYKTLSLLIINNVLFADACVLNLSAHSCMIWLLRVRVWMVIRSSSSHSPVLWATDTSSSTRAHSYQIYWGENASQTAEVSAFPADKTLSLHSSFWSFGCKYRLYLGLCQEV